MTRGIDAVTVHYTGAEYLCRCVQALQESAAGELTISVVDNDAPEPVPEEVRRQANVTVLEAGENLGFARGTNLGARAGEAPYLLFVNPDILLSPAAFSALRGLLDEHPRIAACAPALENPDGTLQVGSAGFLPSVASVSRQAFPVARLFGGTGGRAMFVTINGNARHEEFIEVEWLSAACLLVRRSAFEQVGGFDERFFLYGEDIDLGRRLRARDWDLAYVPRVRVPHRHLPADATRVRRAPECAWLDGLDLYYQLHAPRTRRLLHAIAGTGFALRALLHTVDHGDDAGPSGRRQQMLAFMRRSARLALKG